MVQKNLEIVLVCKRIPFEPGSTNSHNPERDTCHWQSISYKATLRFNMSLREVYSNAGSLRVMKKQDESALMKILQEFGTL